MIKTCRIFAIIILLYLTGTGNTLAYGSSYYGYGFHHYGYPGSYGLSAHYSSYGDISTAGYVILGLLGAILVTSILDDNERYRGTYYSANTYQPPVNYQPRVQPVYKQPEISYRTDEGWEALLTGNFRHALDVFAVQTQQNLNSGVPRIGFSLSAAANGELNRGIRSMQKAIQIDPDSLNQINNDHDLLFMIDLLIEDYSSVNASGIPEPDRSFMIAALSYLKRDYLAARNIVPERDQSQSTINLKNLIDQAM